MITTFKMKRQMPSDFSCGKNLEEKKLLSNMYYQILLQILALGGTYTSSLGASTLKSQFGNLS